jgi:triosephosphate isomerase
MHTSVPEALELAAAIRDSLPAAPLAEVVILPPFISLWPVGQLLGADGAVSVGAQDCFWKLAGAFTGEVSASMLSSLCRYVLVGHSERRQLFGDTDEVVRRKLDAVLAAGLSPILAVGETLSDRDAGRAKEVIGGQTSSGLGGLEASQLLRCTVAYEPIWAIGSGRSAEPADAAEAAQAIRAVVDGFSPGTASKIRVLYGGSVTAASAAALFAPDEVDGGLIGGASLDPAEFCAIVAAVGAVPS